LSAHFSRAVFLSLCFAMGLFAYCSAASAAPVLYLDSAQASYPLEDYAEYLEDKSGKLDIHLVRKFSDRIWEKPTGAVPNFGFSKSAYWFRIKLEGAKSRDRLIGINNPLLDEISLYLFADGRLVQQLQAGDIRPFADRPLKHRAFALPLIIPSAKQLTLYLRVQSEGSIQVPMTLWNDTAFHEQDEVETALIGIYFGIIMVMMLYNLFLYLKVYEPAYIYYVMYVLMFGLFVAGLSGWGYMFLWPQRVDFQQYGLAIFIVFGSIFVCRFTHYFLDLPNTAPRIGKLLVASVYILLVLLCLLPFTSYHLIVQGALVMVFVVSLTALFSGVLLWRQGVVMAPYFTIAWSTFLIAVMLATLEKFGLLSRAFWTESLLPVGMALEVILLSLALGERINRERQQRISAQEEVIALQERNQAELEQKVRDRTVALEEANAKLAFLATTDGLTGIFNRRHLLELGVEALHVAIRYKHSIAVIMLDVDHFKHVNDTYGHDAGDKVLQHIVAICKDLNRETDVFGRLGGEEFGLILLEPAALSAPMVAERIRSRIESSPIDYEGESIGVTVSQGVCELDHPPEGLTIDQMLRVADEALYEAKASGRNRVVVGPDISGSPIHPST